MGKPLRVLNVEDSPQDVALLSRHLTVAGYDVISERVDKADTMMAALTEKEWDIILCDYSMPGFNALAALAVLHRSEIDTPLIIISGTVGEDIAVEAMLTGANDYLPKTNLTRLVPAIERELQAAEDRRQQRRADTERRLIFEIIQGVITAPSLDELLKLVHRSISQIVYAENCFVMLNDPERDINHYEFWVDKNEPAPEPIPAGKGFASYVLRTGEAILLTSESRQQLLAEGKAEQLGSPAASWLGVPLRTPQRTIGVLVLQHYEDESAYSDRDLEFVSLVGDQIALAIERKRSEESVRRSEQRYRALFENAPDGILIGDHNGYFIDVNSSMCEMLGRKREEIIGLDASSIVHPLEVPYIQPALDTIHGHLDYHREWRFRRTDGSFFEAEVIASQMPDGNILAMIRDITERKLAEKALTDSEERYRDMVENAIDIIYTHDLKGNYTSVNRAAEQTTGYTREEVLGMNLFDSVAPEYVEKAKKMIVAKIEGKDVTAYEIEIIAKDGSHVNVEVNTRLIYEDGVAVGVQGIARNVTERRQLEEQFLQSQKMEAIGLLAGGIAHDFNNLLTAITGYSELTLKKMSAEDASRRNIEEIKNAGDRAAGLTGQLLAFSRKQVLKPRVHNVNSVISNIERMLRRIIRESVELRTDLTDDLWNIKADPGQIEQVIMNLAVNARDAMPNGGYLTIRTDNVQLGVDDNLVLGDVEPGEFITITVTDTGEGMDENTQRRIFEPFFTTKEIGKGSGLGLSTVHGIVKQSGGDIRVISEPGHGSTFEIFLPRVAESVEVPKWVGTDTTEHLGSETILLVEDDDIVRNLVREILSGSGYNILEAASGENAIAICNDHNGPIQLLLTDVIMPVMGGLTLKAEILRVRPNVKVLFMSGYTDDSISDSGVFGREFAFIEKPFTPDGLTRKIRDVLDD